MSVRRKVLSCLAVGALLGSAGAASAQNLNDLGRVLQDQVLGGRPNPDRDREAYERGRQDQAEQIRREEDARRRGFDDRRRFEDERRREGDDNARRERDRDRQRADEQRALADEQRARDQSRRY